jgi:hypothetical protein
MATAGREGQTAVRPVGRPSVRPRTDVQILIATGFAVQTRKIFQWRVAINTLRVAACNRSDFLLEIVAKNWTSVLGLSATVLAFGRPGLHSTAVCSDRLPEDTRPKKSIAPCDRPTRY